MKSKVLVITGPTASGKTKIAIEVAKKLNGEIISADSMQIYREMNVGTAKPSNQEMQEIQHYMINIIDIGENFNVAKYKDMASKYIEKIFEKGKLPILVGGTGLYINSMVEEINYDDSSQIQEIRNQLEQEAEEKGLKALYEELKKVDEVASAKISPNDRKRIIRALEVYKITGKTITEIQISSKEKNKKYDYIIIGLNVPRGILYERINLRVDKMIEMGLETEAKEILEKSDRLGTSFQAIGYKEWKNFFNNQSSFDETVNKIKQESRRYAKRQMTWFRKNREIHWLDADKTDIVDEICNILKNEEGF